MKLPISPLEGEMPGRAEGGAVPLAFQLTKVCPGWTERVSLFDRKVAFLRAPLWLAGHLPLKGGD
ncbi:hypothetical protein X747_14195 [Mesorhizobium sp. LNJC384A00]|nr:hypothetical protein X747_14195 [Mesorhizobium sp. LNJC384A00]ESZ52622.1 hypothetical protein X730_01170 [Mesorhizobium sp. L103C565B0]